jgi:hypothetical protein
MLLGAPIRRLCACQRVTQRAIPAHSRRFGRPSWRLVGFYGRLVIVDCWGADSRDSAPECALHGLHVFAAKRVDIESFRGDMETAGRARATMPRCTSWRARWIP